MADQFVEQRPFFGEEGMLCALECAKAHFFYLQLTLLYFSGKGSLSIRYWMKNHRLMKKRIPLLLSIIVVLIVIGAWTAPGTAPECEPARDFFSVENPGQSNSVALREACYDCHSYATDYPLYAYIPPISNWIQGHVRSARRDLNFSEWGSMDDESKSDHLRNIIKLIKEGVMPPPAYQWMHPGARWTEAKRDSVLAFLASRRQDYLQQAQVTACEWCGAQDAPDDLSWQTTIPPDNEPGEPLIIEGRVFQPNGRTPAEDVLIYVYHTNSEGIYPKRGNETGNGRRHGYLRGWMKTGPDGRYRFTTIRPAGYPGRPDPAHIHITLTPPGEEEYWIDSYWFEGDPRITNKMRKRRTRPAGDLGMISLKKDDQGRWRGKRDIVLR